MYKIRYLPLAVKDLREITDYIADNLKSSKCCNGLIKCVG